MAPSLHARRGAIRALGQSSFCLGLAREPPTGEPRISASIDSV